MTRRGEKEVSRARSADVYAEFLARREAGEEVDFEELCGTHPALEAELRALHGGWDSFEAVLERLGADHSVTARILRRYGEEAAPEVTIRGEEEPAADFTSDVLARLAKRRGNFGRYRLKGEVARGGQGVVLRVWDEDLRRNLAMKVILGKGNARRGATPAVDSRSLGRFMEEAQVTGQLDHPGIVPVHELGLDAEGHVYFTMKLVHGRDLKAIFDRVHRSEEGWTQARALGVMLKACEAMAYAHSRGVIHRDLKPSNVMVGPFGEVYVMDWGLARVLGREDKKDVRIDPVTSSSALLSERHALGSGTPRSPLVTMDGDVVGTPAYMSPEQAAGDLGRMGCASDVYSAGAMLYHLLSGHMPYAAPGVVMSNYAIWRQVQQDKPTPLEELAPNTPAELVAICEKAMARDPSDRYEDMRELAEDLRAFLEGRVVRAHRTGRLAALEKWIRRNRLLAGTVVAAGAVLLITSLVLLARIAREVRAKESALIERNRLSLGPVALDLRQRARALPLELASVERTEAWLRDAEALLEEAEVHRATPGRDLDENIVGVLDELRRVHDVLRRRTEIAADLARISVDEHAAEWEQAIREIAADGRYHGPDGRALHIEPQVGLVPLGASPHSGLQEFWVVLSGERPRDVHPETGHWRIEERTGIVLVLLPGDPDYLLGSTDPRQDQNRRTCHVELDPFFLAKYEVTQGQWKNVHDAPWGLLAENPSTFLAGTSDVAAPGGAEYVFGLRNPVDSVTWDEADSFCRHLDLVLPTEAQWEYGARAGTRSVYWFGDDPRAAAGFENFSGPDGLPFHAPAGSLAPNDFGLFDVLGGVAEWCRDRYAQAYGPPRRDSGDGLAPEAPDPAAKSPRLTRVLRGGSWYVDEWPCATRGVKRPDWRSEDQGFRVARPLRPSPFAR